MKRKKILNTSHEKIKKIKLALLDHIYRIYEEDIVSDDTACKRGCALCCTRNVTLTGLEALRIAEHIRGKPEYRAALRSASEKKRFRPVCTFNQIAEICMRGGDFPEEEMDPAWTPCPLLKNAECSIYPIRPFGCRCMISMRSCAENNYAEMSEFTATINDVFLQYIEHIDAGGCFGNLTDMLLFLEDEKRAADYPRSIPEELPEALIPNHPLKVLMVPPEFRGKIRPVLQKLEKNAPDNAH
jgi:Fe-S-cluster containining protein